jgi:hypothetical protein
MASSIGMAAGYGLDDRRVGIRVPVASRFFISPQCPGLLWGPPNRYRGLIPLGVKRPGREDDHSPPTSDEVKKALIYTFTFPYPFMA